MPGADGAPPVVELVLLAEVAWLEGGAMRTDMMICGWRLLLQSFDVRICKSMP